MSLVTKEVEGIKDQRSWLIAKPLLAVRQIILV